jgi:toxin-antitoxin system PIN domain toxin
LTLIDANLLLFAVDERSPFHTRARDWLTGRLNGEQPVGLPWQSLGAFLRIVTHPRISTRPLEPPEAWERVQEWLACDVTWLPVPTERHPTILGELIERYQLRGNLIPDAQLAALAIEHGVEVCSADTDFARFEDVRWHNPLAQRSS